MGGDPIGVLFKDFAFIEIVPPGGIGSVACPRCHVYKAIVLNPPEVTVIELCDDCIELLHANTRAEKGGGK